MGALLRNLVHAASVLTMWGCAAALVAVFVARGAWPFCLVTPFVPQIGIVALLAVLGHLFFARGERRLRPWIVRSLGLVVSVVVTAIVFGGAFGRKVPALPTAEAGTAPQLGVLVCNVYSENRDVAAVQALVAKCDPDLVLLLEINRRWLEGLAGLAECYPHRHAMPDEFGNFGIGVWSKHPFGAGGIAALENEVPQVDVTLRLPEGREVRFLGVHPLPPVSQGAVVRRAAVLRWVAERCRGSVPTIVAGDFNATAYCDSALELAATTGLRDATATLHHSWPSDDVMLPFAIRIDHVWASGDLRCISASREAFVGSDHFPVFARLAY